MPSPWTPATALRPWRDIPCKDLPLHGGWAAQFRWRGCRRKDPFLLLFRRLMSDGQRVLPHCRGSGEEWLGGLVGLLSPASPPAAASNTQCQDSIPHLLLTMAGKSLLAPLLPRQLWSVSWAAASATTLQWSSRPWAAAGLSCQVAEQGCQRYAAITRVAHSRLIGKTASVRELPLGARNRGSLCRVLHLVALKVSQSRGPSSSPRKVLGSLLPRKPTYFLFKKICLISSRKKHSEKVLGGKLDNLPSGFFS